MLDFLVRNSTIKATQKFIDSLSPKVNIHVPEDLPLPSMRRLKKYCENVAKINSYDEEYSKLSDEQLQKKTDDFKARYEEAVKDEKEIVAKLYSKQINVAVDEKREEITIELNQARESLKVKRKKVLDEILPEAFAVVRETGKRLIGLRHYDVQMVGGMVLNDGDIAEMTTGEGKTLVATLPTYLNGITGEGVHVVTVNDYLAGRDRDWMAPIYEFLGLTVGVIQHDMMPSERKVAYACDITYGTNNEFGFDYLRDNMVVEKDMMVQRPHYFAVVDEVDSILIDEARTPLIISGPAEESTDKYAKAFEITKSLTGKRITEKDEIDAKHAEIDLAEGVDYLADEKARSISLTDTGEEKAAQLFGIDNLHDMETIEYRHHILQALKAKEFFKRDVDYVIRDGEVIIVDEFTGRMMPGRRWSDGLHQAVEASEGIKIERENQTLATITFQNYFRLYEKLAGMTGTADTEANEFKQIYDLDVMVMPTNKPLQRLNYPDSIYKTVQEKFTAVIGEIEEFHKRGQPVLVGTISIEKSELIAQMLKNKGIAHQVLNAKHHTQEANIIAQAGRLSGVTIATNMAGRGTDIVLGGNPEFLAKNLAAQKLKGNESEEEFQASVEKFILEFKDQCKADQKKVLEAGGLHVIGTERHESRRIDNQLRGRQGRQGDPGSSRFFVSLQDDLMRLFASDKIIGLMDKLGMEEGQALEHPWLNKALENAQKKVESHNFEIRKHLLDFDDVMNRQREVVYELRRSILERTDVKPLVLEALDETVADAVYTYLSSAGEQVKWDLDGLLVYLKTTFLVDFAPHKEKLQDKEEDEIRDMIMKAIGAIYEQRERDIGADRLRYFERMMYLNIIDTKWKDHLYGMDQLKEGIGLRSYGQRDPLIEYKKEGFHMFQMMYGSINKEMAEIVFKVQPAENPTRPKGVFTSLPQELVHEEAETFQAPTPSAGSIGASTKASEKSAPVQNIGPKVGRNDPCSCGSGKKYKKCCAK